MVAHRFECPFTVDLLLQSPQGLLHGLAFFQFNFGQNTFTSSPETLDSSGLNRPALLFSQAQQVILWNGFVNRQILCYC